jgi:hypothetical protein
VLRSRVLIMAIMFYARLRMPAGLPSGGWTRPAILSILL